MSLGCLDGGIRTMDKRRWRNDRGLGLDSTASCTTRLHVLRLKVRRRSPPTPPYSSGGKACLPAGDSANGGGLVALPPGGGRRSGLPSALRQPFFREGKEQTPLHSSGQPINTIPEHRSPKGQNKVQKRSNKGPKLYALLLCVLKHVYVRRCFV